MRFLKLLSFARFAILLLPILGIAMAIQVGCTFSSDAPANTPDSGSSGSPDAAPGPVSGNPDSGGNDGTYGYGYGYGCGGDDGYGDYGYDDYAYEYGDY